MRRLFWLGLGATLGSVVTRKVTELRTTLTWSVLLKSVTASLPSVLNSLRSLAVNTVRTLQTKKP